MELKGIKQVRPNSLIVPHESQETVDAADIFPVVWSRFQEWLKTLGPPFEIPTDLCVFDVDLKTILPEQLAHTATLSDFSPAVPRPLDC
jgi:inhibitor of KinA sporulation pathway (predicted exonuclease)